MKIGLPDNIKVTSVFVIVHTHHKHGSIFGRSRNDNFLGSRLQMNLKKKDWLEKTIDIFMNLKL